MKSPTEYFPILHKIHRSKIIGDLKLLNVPSGFFLTSEFLVHIVSHLAHDGVNHSSRGRLVLGHPPAAGELVEGIAGVPLGVDGLQDSPGHLGAFLGHAHLLGSNHGLGFAGAVGRDLEQKQEKRRKIITYNFMV